MVARFILPGAQEYIQVFQEELTVKVNNEEFRVVEGDAMRFTAD